MASIVAAGSGGIVLALLFAGAEVVEFDNGLSRFAATLFVALVSGFFIGAVGVIMAVVLAGLPALILGNLLWGIGDRHPWARRRVAYAGLGALVGVGAWAIIGNPLAGEGSLMTHPPDQPVAIALFALAGGAAGLVFRSMMRPSSVHSYQGERPDGDSRMDQGHES